MLPIVERELRATSRDPKLYRRRVRWGVIQVMGACAILLFSAGGFKPSTAEWFFSTLSFFALLLCLLEGVRKTSDAISSEKREGTLGFLFLSNLNGADVIFGKFGGALIRSLSVLLPFLPVLAISLLVGGTTLGEFWRVALVLIATLVWSLSICLFVSACSLRNSVLAALVVIVLLCLGPWLVSQSGRLSLAALANPFEALNTARDASYSMFPRKFWAALAFLGSFSFAGLVGASILTPRVWQQKSNVLVPRSKNSKRRRKVRALLEVNPVYWLNYQRRGRMLLAAMSLLCLIAGLAPFAALWFNFGESAAWAAFPAIAAAILCIVIWIGVAFHTASTLAEAKRDGSLELLLSTPLTVAEVMKGYWLALWANVRLPVLCLFGLMVSAAVASGLSDTQALWTGKFVVELFMEIAVLGAVGMWMGLKAKTRAAAVVYTIILGGLVPHLACIFTILIQIVLLLRALDQVRAILRRMRAGNLSNYEGLLQPPLIERTSAPPVIR